MICVSDFTAGDVCARYGVDAATHPRGAATRRRCRSARRAEPPATASPTCSRSGTCAPKKNLAAPRARRGACSARPGTGSCSPALGERDGAAGAASRLVGYVDDERLDALMRGADVLVHPSLYEGFGLVVLEAMARGVPVAAAGATALPETGGDAAVYFDPLDAARSRAAIREALDGPRRPAPRAGARARGAVLLASAPREETARGLPRAPVTHDVLMLSVDEAHLLERSLPAAVAQAGRRGRRRSTTPAATAPRRCARARRAAASRCASAGPTPRRSTPAWPPRAATAVLLLNADCVLEPGFVAAAARRASTSPASARSRRMLLRAPGWGPRTGSASSTRPA